MESSGTWAANSDMPRHLPFVRYLFLHQSQTSNLSGRCPGWNDKYLVADEMIEIFGHTSEYVVAREYVVDAR